MHFKEANYDGGAIEADRFIDKKIVRGPFFSDEVRDISREMVLLKKIRFRRS